AQCAGWIAAGRAGGADDVHARSAVLLRKPAAAVARWLALRDVRVRVTRLVRLLLDSHCVPEGDLVHGVAAPVGTVRVRAGAHGDDHARPVPGAYDRVLRLRRAVHEVPWPERALLAFDDQERLTREHEEVLLVGLPPV